MKTLSDKFEPAGQYKTEWNGLNDVGEKVSAGVYFYSIRAGKTVMSGKMVLMPK